MAALDVEALGDIIDESVQSEGAILHDILAVKKAAAEESLGGDPKRTYLRIAFGDIDAESPGHPNIVEIWPAGHESPIHEHASCYSIIKFLRGGVRNYNYPQLSSLPQSQKPIKQAMLTAGDITWIAPNRFQIHRLVNSSDTTAISFHAYQYPEEHDALFVRRFEAFDFANVHGDLVSGVPPRCDCGDFEREDPEYDPNTTTKRTFSKFLKRLYQDVVFRSELPAAERRVRNAEATGAMEGRWVERVLELPHPTEATEASRYEALRLVSFFVRPPRGTERTIPVEEQQQQVAKRVLELGFSSISVETRLAALHALKQIWSHWEPARSTLLAPDQDHKGGVMLLLALIGLQTGHLPCAEEVTQLAVTTLKHDDLRTLAPRDPTQFQRLGAMLVKVGNFGRTLSSERLCRNIVFALEKMLDIDESFAKSDDTVVELLARMLTKSQSATIKGKTITLLHKLHTVYVGREGGDRLYSSTVSYRKFVRDPEVGRALRQRPVPAELNNTVWGGAGDGDGDRVVQVYEGEEVEVLSEDTEGFTQVRNSLGQVGYLRSHYLENT